MSLTLTMYKRNKDAVLKYIKEHTRDDIYYVVTVEEDEKGTNRQNDLFHALLSEWYASGHHDYKSYKDMRNSIKLMFRKPSEFIYLTKELKQITVPRFSDIPENILGYVSIPDSWANFTKKQRKDTIDYVIASMMQMGVCSEKFDEIMRGIGQ